MSFKVDGRVEIIPRDEASINRETRKTVVVFKANEGQSK